MAKTAQLKRHREAKQKAFCLQNCLKLRTLTLKCDCTITAKVRFLSHFSKALKKNTFIPTADSKIGTDTKYIKPFFVSFMFSCFFVLFLNFCLFVGWKCLLIKLKDCLVYFMYTPQALLHQNMTGLLNRRYGILSSRIPVLRSHFVHGEAHV